jgi:hypothetical protein
LGKTLEVERTKAGRIHLSSRKARTGGIAGGVAGIPQDCSGKRTVDFSREIREAVRGTPV